jgi:hypothetical protein
MDTFFTLDVQSAAIQIMETLYIIATSKNINTIEERYDFLLTRIPTLRSAKSNSQYSTIIRTAIDQFKTLHPAVSALEDYQLTALDNPDIFDFTDFYCNSLINAIKRFCEKQSEEIKALKKEVARAKRISKVIETINSTQHELEAKCSSALSFQTVLSEFKKLSDTFSENLLNN